MLIGAEDPKAYTAKLVTRLLAAPREDEQCEFKVNNSAPDEIGEYISALANSAAIAGCVHGYVVWGVTDDHEVVGTNFRPDAKKVGNEELQNWLLHLLRPQSGFRFIEGEVRGKRVVVLEIDAAAHEPSKFKGVDWVRIGSYKKKLADHPHETRKLWRAFESRTFESGIAKSGLSVDDVLALIDYPSYFQLLGLRLPGTPGKIIDALLADGIVAKNEIDDLEITNLGAILFAADLSRFPTLDRKAMRVIQYVGTTREEAVGEQAGALGYANGFEGLVMYVNNRLPANEVVGEALRRNVRLYPELAIRELLANALIHQDVTIRGTGPVVEIFGDRLEVTNPGVPLVDSRRFVDYPPRSRNEAIAALMRRIGVCEERGSGWDKIGFQIELHQLPAPEIQVTPDHTKVILFGHRPLLKMDKDDRVRAVYLHACLRYVSHENTTNGSIRQRFGIEDKNSATASRLISDAVSAGVIVPYDSTVGRRAMRYVPYWAQETDA